LVEEIGLREYPGDPNEATIYAAIGGWKLTKVLVSGRPGAV
jgi:hypothetical protein